MCDHDELLRDTMYLGTLWPGSSCGEDTVPGAGLVADPDALPAREGWERCLGGARGGGARCPPHLRRHPVAGPLQDVLRKGHATDLALNNDHLQAALQRSSTVHAWLQVLY